MQSAELCLHPLVLAGLSLYSLERFFGARESETASDQKALQDQHRRGTDKELGKHKEVAGFVPGISVFHRVRTSSASDKMLEIWLGDQSETAYNCLSAVLLDRNLDRGRRGGACGAHTGATNWGPVGSRGGCGFTTPL